MKISFRFLDFVSRSKKIHRFYRRQNLLYLVSLLSLFFNFYSDVDKFNQGLSINSFQGELYILGINLFIIQSVLIIYNIEKKTLDKKIEVLENFELNLVNLSGIIFSIYIISLYFFITQSNAFGVNPLFKTYGIGFYSFITIQIVSLIKIIKFKKK